MKGMIRRGDEQGREQPIGESRRRVLARCGRFGTDDPFLHEEAIRPVEAICTPLGRSYRIDMAYLATPAVLLYQECFGGAVRARGSLPLGMMSFCIPVRLAPGSTVGKSPLRNSGIPCSMGGVLDIALTEGHVHVVLLIDLDHLRRALPSHSFKALQRAASKLLVPTSASSLERLGTWLSRVLHEALIQPRMLQFPEAVRSLEEDLVTQLAEAVGSEPTKSLIDRPYSRARGLDRAMDYLHSRPLADISLPSLCEAAAVSQRTLERAFRDQFDMSARDYLKRRRLHSVRRCLMTARKGEARIADIAYAHGFYELGRFAAVYAQAFGERPSETLGRAFPEPRAVLIRP